MNRVPSDRTPTNAPIVTSETVDVTTTRVPATMTGAARGSSTCQNRSTVPKPQAVALRRVARSMAEKPSALWRTSTATPYRVRMSTMLTGER